MRSFARGRRSWPLLSHAPMLSSHREAASFFTRLFVIIRLSRSLRRCSRRTQRPRRRLRVPVAGSLCTLLHSAAPLELFAALLAAHPGAASTADNRGYLPLHSATLVGFGARPRAAFDVVVALLLEYPEGALKRTSEDDVEFPNTLPDFSVYPQRAIRAALEANAAARRRVATLAWHIWHR